MLKSANQLTIASERRSVRFSPLRNRTRLTGVVRNFDWRRGPNWKKIYDIILVTFFGDLMVMTSKFDCVIISLEKHSSPKSRNFRSPILKVKGLFENLLLN